MIFAGSISRQTAFENVSFFEGKFDGFLYLDASSRSINVRPKSLPTTGLNYVQLVISNFFSSIFSPSIIFAALQFVTGNSGSKFLFFTISVLSYFIFVWFEIVPTLLEGYIACSSKSITYIIKSFVYFLLANQNAIASYFSTFFYSGCLYQSSELFQFGQLSQLPDSYSSTFLFSFVFAFFTFFLSCVLLVAALLPSQKRGSKYFQSRVVPQFLASYLFTMDLNYLSLAGVSQVDFSFPAPYHFTLKQGFPLTNFLPTIFSGRLCCINNQNTLITLMITYSQFRGSLQIRVVQFTYDFINQIRMKKENFIHPPDLSKSEAHRKATRIFKGLEHDETGEQCQCCGRRIGMQKITGKCCYSDLQLAFLGSGLPLFFNFIKSSIMILVALCLVFCVFALTTNVLGNYCQKQGLCAPNIFNTLSLVNKINDISYLSVQNYVLLVFVLLFSLLMQLIRYRARKIISVCDSLINSPSDYAAMISRLPHGVTEADIKSMIQERRDFLTEEQKQSTKNLEVVKIILGFKMGKYIDAIQSNKKSFKASILQNHDFYPEQLPELNETSAIAVILFATQEGKDLFLYEASCLQKMCQSICDPCTPLSDHTIFGQRIAVERAPEPDDIIWENSNLSIKGAIGRKIGYNLLSFAILAVGGAAQYGLAVLETTLTNEKLIQYVGMASSIFVALMNEVIYKFLIYTAQKERKLTQTKINTNLIIKMGFFLFLNAGVFMVAARILAQIKTFELSGTLSMQITQIMILNTITPHLSLIATDYLQIPAVLKRWAVRKDYLFATQMSANILYEKPTPEVSFKYGYLIRTLWLTALYCPLTPIVVPISVVGLLLNLAVQKCLHYKSYRTPNMVSSRQNATALEMMEFVPLIMSCGQFLIYLYFYRFRIELIPNYWAIPIYVSLGLSGLQILLPLQLVNKRLFKIDQENNRLSYLEIENTFEATYEMVNPGYKSSVKRNRDKLLLKSLYKQIEELVELKPKEPLKQFLIGLGTKEDEIESNPLHILFKNQHFMTAFNTNQVY